MARAKNAQSASRLRWWEAARKQQGRKNCEEEEDEEEEDQERKMRNDGTRGIIAGVLKEADTV